MPDTADAPLHQFQTALRDGDTGSLFPALQDFCQATLGHLLFSCSAFHLDGSQSGVAARIHTSDEQSYPRSGLKDIQQNRWTQQVVEDRRTFVANSVEGFADVFPDHAQIAAMGLGSVVNMPVIVRGKFLGTVNMLHRAGYYTDDRLARLHDLVLPATLAFVTAPLAP